ncbi:hypothetical protein [Streptomyces sp. NPDC047718]|uniref:hypothetical protein n=1 Tax=Streptomyces sp. NPDC047718 TaxID=3155479 RepID=UPI0033C2981E
MDKLHVVRFEVIGDSGRDEEDDDGTDVKTTFAFYGLAMYHANVLEHGLVNALALSRVLEAREQAERLLRDPWEQRFKDTMKELVRRARRHAGDDEGLVEALTVAADRRNHLAHDFWRVSGCGMRRICGPSSTTASTRRRSRRGRRRYTGMSADGCGGAAAGVRPHLRGHDG